MLKHYGDLRIVKKHYDSLTTFMEVFTLYKKALPKSVSFLYGVHDWVPLLH